MVNKERIIQRDENAFGLLAYTFELSEEQFGQIEDLFQTYRDNLAAGNDEIVTLERYETDVSEVVNGSLASKYEVDQLAHDILMILSSDGGRYTDIYEYLYLRVS